MYTEVAELLSRPFQLLRNRNFILLLAFALGMLFDRGARFTENMVVPALAFVMMLSTMTVTRDLFRSPRSYLYAILVGIMMNYVVHGGLILILNNLFPLEESSRIGFAVLAAVPPAVAVLPFTSFLDGDLGFSLLGTLGCYLVAFAATPIVLSASLGVATGLQVKLFVMLVELIVIPLILSRILFHTGVAARIIGMRGPLINWSFFLVVYTVVGLNKETFLSRPQSVIPVALIAGITTFVLGYSLERLGHYLKIDRKRVISIILLGTSKNTGFSAGLALTLFNTQTAVPSTIMTIFLFSNLILLDIKRGWKKARD